MHTGGEGGGAHGNRNPLHNQIDGQSVKCVISGGQERALKAF